MALNTLERSPRLKLDLNPSYRYRSPKKTTTSDNTNTQNMEALNNKEQQEFQKIVEQKQMKDFMRLYSNLVEKCFSDCVEDFTSSKLNNRELTCISKCAEKFLKHSERVGKRFQEQNALMNQNLR